MQNETQKPDVQNVHEQIKQEISIRNSQRDIQKIKSLFNWGELSRMLAGTRAVVLKNQYPKKHEPFISDLCEAVRPVLVKYGHLDEPVLVIPTDEIIEVRKSEPDCDGSQHSKWDESQIPVLNQVS